MRAGNEYLTPGKVAVIAAQGEKIAQGDMVGINESGFAETATKTSTQVIGVAINDVDATQDTGISVVRRGCFIMKNKDLAQGDLFKTCYVSDAQTVTKDATGSVAAGTAIALEGSYAVVEIGGYHNGN